MSAPEQSARAVAQSRYGHGGLHASAAHTEDIMDAFVKGAEWGRAEGAAEVREAVKREIADQLWRKTPCGCNHRADLHSMGGDPGSPSVCTGGLGLCGCTWSFVQIADARIRAALDAAGANS